MVEVTEFKDDEFFVNVTREEAMRLIETLANQIMNNNMNSGRAEFFKRSEEDTSYFTIGVKEITEPTQPTIGEMYIAFLESLESGDER